MGVSPFFIVLFILAVIMAGQGLAHARSRPYVLNLLVIGGVVVLALTFVRHSAVPVSEVRVAEVPAVRENSRHFHVAQKAARRFERDSTPAAPSRPDVAEDAAPRSADDSTVSEPASRRKIGILDGLRRAITKAWREQSYEPYPTVPVTTPKTAETAEHEPSASTAKPAWVDAAPHTQNGVYLTERCVGPYTTLLECENDLPKALQGAVAEYAQIALGPELAKQAHLPDDELRPLVREHWDETRPTEFGGSTQDMYCLHVLAGFDAAAKERIRAAAEQTIVAQRLKGGGVALGGLLGLLALAWGGLWLAKQ